MKKTRLIHTVTFITIGIAFTVIGVIAAHDIRGEWLFGGEYFIPFLMFLLWKFDRAILNATDKEVRK